MMFLLGLYIGAGIVYIYYDEKLGSFAHSQGHNWKWRPWKQTKSRESSI